MQQKEGVCKKRLTGKEQLTTLPSLDDDHELPFDLWPDFSVHVDILKGVQDSNMVASSPHIGVSLDNVRSGLSDSSKVSPPPFHPTLPSTSTWCGGSGSVPPCTLVSEGEVHAGVTGMVPPALPQFVLPFNQAQGCVRGACTMCHKQQNGDPAGSPVHLVPHTWSHA